MRTLLMVLVSLLAVGCVQDESSEVEADTSASEMEERDPAEAIEDPEAARVYRAVMDSIAPNGGWDRTRYVEFDWIVDRGEGEPLRRSHRWDRFEGAYRVQAPTEAGEMVALFDVDSPTEDERIWIEGERVNDEARSDSLARDAHSMFINDSYWLLFPFKWADPGVTTRYLGEMEEWGETYEVVELTFDDVGLTPQNRYRAFVDPETGMFELWQHFSSADDEEPAFTNRWTDWREYGPILLSSQREGEDGTSTIYFENLGASTEVPDGAFSDPGS